MPIYEYRCPACGKLTEVFQRTSKGELPPSCPSCGHDKMERQFSCFSSSSGSSESRIRASGSCGPSSRFR
jgi:putative FmdB family regulatory protein